MSGGRGQVHLGDLVRAVVALGVTEPADVAEIASVLGLGGRESARGDEGAAEWGRDWRAGRRAGEGPGSVGEFGVGTRSADEVPDAAEAGRPVAPVISSMPAAASALSPRDGGLSVLSLRAPIAGTSVRRSRRGAEETGAVQTGTVQAGTVQADAESVDLLLDEGDTTVERRPPEPVWPLRWAPGVMFAAASTDVVGRTVDERALARRVAHRPFVRRLPLRERPTTRHGIQLLVDDGESMSPFRADQRWLRQLASGVLGRDRVALLHFLGTPSRGVRRAGRRGLVPYVPPGAGTPVVLVSDLGLRRLPFSGDAAAGSGEWTDWIDGVRRAGCPVVCLTPYESRAHPWSMRRRVSLVPLDRRTSIRSAWRETRRLREGARR